MGAKIEQEIKKLSNEDTNNVFDLISYISDIHLLHRYAAWKCETEEERDWVTDNIVDQLSINDPKTRIKLIGGDVSSDFEVYSSFVSKLSQKKGNSDYFFTLGNHELWPFAGENLGAIVEKYRDLLSKNGMRLVHNNLFYYDADNLLKEITEKELKSLGAFALEERVQNAQLIIFGGTGFAGRNEEYNANNGIYREAVSRNLEITESCKFEQLYELVISSLSKKRVIVFTHMKRRNWSRREGLIKGFIYVSGHDHRNHYYDDGEYRVYSDNQIGYKQKTLKMKHLSIAMRYENLRDYPDGIHKINRDNYINFYRKLNEYVHLNRDYKDIYMLKKQGVYMFFLVTHADNLLLLNGGTIKFIGNHPLEYFYERMVPYSESIKMFLSKFDKLQKEIAQELKELGADGYIHGCIIDIDFCNHLYINPLDGSITPYFAPFSMVEKYVYKNVPSLLKYNCPKLYDVYKRKTIDKKSERSLISYGDGSLSAHKECIESTAMYSMSRIIKGLQFITNYNVIRVWNDEIALEASSENGKVLVSNMLNGPKTKRPYRHTVVLSTIKQNRKEKEAKGYSPAWSKKELKYKKKVAEITQTIEVLKYNGTQLKTEYKCKVCGYCWEQTPNEFQHVHICPKCGR